MTTEIRPMKLDDIRIDGGTQPRVAINQDIVADYAEDYGRGENLPPVTVFFDGNAYWLADGFHRYWATKKINSEYIMAEIRPGSKRDAVLYSAGANSSHGLRRTNLDKQKAVLTLLKDNMWSAWSDREIAKRCAVDAHTVAKYRASLAGPVDENPDSSDARRIYKTRHGTLATMKVGKIGRSDRSQAKPANRVDQTVSLQRSQSDNGRTPTRAVYLSSNNPRQAARQLVRLYGQEYMRELAAELNEILN